MSVSVTSLIVWACRGGNERRIFVGLGRVSHGEAADGGPRGHIPGRAQDRIPENDQLGHNTQEVQVRPIREQEVPQPQHLRQRRRARAQRQHGREGVQLGRHALADQVQRQLRVHDGQHLVHEREALVHAVHGAAHVARALVRDEAVERHERLGLAARGVQERRREHVHALHVGARVAGAGAAAGVGALGRERERARAGAGRGGLQLGAAVGVGGVREPGGGGVVGARVPGVVQLPGDGVEEADQAGLADAAAEEGVGGEGAEGVVADLGVGGRGAAVDEGEIVVGVEDGGVEEDHPDVDAERGLVGSSVGLE
jgi:hypothetical protein